jgi:hypothetical protein
MSMLNLNNPQSIRDALKRTEEELQLQTKGVWPHHSMVPEHTRTRYRETLIAQSKYLQNRLTESLSQNNT